MNLVNQDIKIKILDSGSTKESLAQTKASPDGLEFVTLIEDLTGERYFDWDLVDDHAQGLEGVELACRKQIDTLSLDPRKGGRSTRCVLDAKVRCITTLLLDGAYFLCQFDKGLGGRPGLNA